MTGSQVSRVAYPLLIFSLGGTAAQAGLVGAAALIPYVIVGIPAGTLADRWNRKWIMIACDLGRLLALAGIPVAAALGRLTLWQLALTVITDSGLYVLFNAAEIAALPRVVGEEWITDALAQGQASLHAALLAGPSLGGFLFGALGRTVPFLLDAASYGVSALGLLFVRAEMQGMRQGEGQHLLRELSEGLVWLWRHRLVRFLSLTTGGVFFVGNACYLILIVLARQQHASSLGIGLVLAAGSVGGLLGSLLAGWVGRHFCFVTIVAGSIWLQTLLLPLYAIAPNPVILAVVASAVALTEAACDPVRYGYQLSLIPDALRGRVNSAASTLVFIPMWLGSAAAGVLLQTAGATGTVLLFAGMLAVLAALTSINQAVCEVGVVG